MDAGQKGVCDMKREPFLDEYARDVICEYYDNNPNLTLRNLAGMLGMTVPEVKKILMSDRPTIA